MSNVL